MVWHSEDLGGRTVSQPRSGHGAGERSACALYRGTHVGRGGDCIPVADRGGQAAGAEGDEPEGLSRVSVNL